jgi:hypothetical protein
MITPLFLQFDVGPPQVRVFRFSTVTNEGEQPTPVGEQYENFQGVVKLGDAIVKEAVIEFMSPSEMQVNFGSFEQLYFEPFYFEVTAEQGETVATLVHGYLILKRP